MADSEGGKVTVDQLRGQLAATEHDLRAAQARILQVEQRATLAEKAARDAWAFARTVLRRPAD